MQAALPAPGQVVTLTRRASPQFHAPVVLRVTRVQDRPPSIDGWAWIEGYVLDPEGHAVSKRAVFVNLDGLGADRR